MIHQVPNSVLPQREMLQNRQARRFGKCLKKVRISFSCSLAEFPHVIHRHRAMILLYGDEVKEYLEFLATVDQHATNNEPHDLIGAF